MFAFFQIAWKNQGRLRPSSALRPEKASTGLVTLFIPEKPQCDPGSKSDGGHDPFPLPNPGEEPRIHDSSCRTRFSIF